ncbi:MAG TPA: ATP-dependent DNA ligase [Candidatus Ruania gallistercoris]|uniref:DNA ligase (ATP) n=1 Tax=Candidatus Ruania gallistercoris TaxID=2838746 RepID=A0A9D2ECS1_9MICO|nr:ATP-dependent DNA ligase [Candidatus Ruania gallistercoris]
MASPTLTELDGRRLQLTSLDKVLYPATGTTKAEVIDYSLQVAGAMLPHCAGRPVTRKRWVDGVGTAADPGAAFFTKNLDSGTPDWVVRADLQHSDHRSTYPLVNDRASLVWMAQMAALELHVPQWRFGSAGEVLAPDRIVFDLDPGAGVSLPEVAEVATWVRDILTGMGWACVPVTSGSKGIHVYAALDGGASADQVRAVAQELAKSLEADHPDRVISRMKRAERAGKVFIDWSQNHPNKTTIAPYSLRGTVEPYAAAPRSWDELADPGLRQLRPAEVLERLAEHGDLMTAGLAGAAGADALDPYRGKRRADRTPEPVPDAVRLTGEQVFVVHEHHARRLHWDLRMSYCGVLTSFAVPKGLPTDPARQHLAVQTEDHPLDYLTFSGTIPAGEYGAGTMSVWDTGTFEVHKWWLGKEIIVTLHGGDHGPLAEHAPAKYALICTDPAERQWLVHAMKHGAGSRAAPRTASPAVAGTPASTSDHPPPAPTQASPAVAGSPTTPPEHPEPAPGQVSPAVVRPMLATSGTPADVGENWAIEMKWDGQRVLARIEAEQVRLWARSGREITTSYPELAELDLHADSALLDGEVVALDPEGRPSFALLQPRMQASAAEVARAARRQPVHYLAFDVLEVNGQDLTRQTYTDRRDLLARLIEPTDHVQVPEAFDGDLDAALAASHAYGLEGVLAKHPDSKYLPGRRSSTWIKIKHTEAVDVVICGWRPGRGERTGQVGSLLVAVPTDDGELRYVGRVGTGFSSSDTRRWPAMLAPEEIEAPAVLDVPAADARDARWLQPVRVAEVEFGEWTPTGRLRHPRWRGWRPDLTPAQISAPNAAPGR